MALLSLVPTFSIIGSRDTEERQWTGISDWYAHSSSCTVATIGHSGKRLHSQVVAPVRLVDIHTTRHAIARRYMIRLRRDDGFRIGQQTLKQPSPRIGPQNSISIAVR